MKKNRKFWNHLNTYVYKNFPTDFKYSEAATRYLT